MCMSGEKWYGEVERVYSIRTSINKKTLPFVHDSFVAAIGSV